MQFHPPLITALWAGLNGLLALGLAINVTRNRWKLRIPIGDGGNPVMLQAIRTHANNIEYVPLALVLLAVAEMAGAPGLAVHVLGGGLLLGRVLHALGLTRSTGTSPGRAAGMALTWLMIALSCLYALYLFAIGGR